jgi:hypothetical protein
MVASRMQRKYFDAAISVTADRLVVHTFGTPFLAVPLAQLHGRVSEGSGWFGPPYLELTLEGGLEYLKLRALYRPWPGRTRIRIYTERFRELRLVLGA